MTGKRMAVDEIMAIVKRDRAYYDLSVGGLTLSGGEPLVQFDFTRELFNAVKDSGTNSCLETCGAVSQDRFAELLPLVDVFLFDYKATNSETHRRLTGASNELILSNLDFLYNNGAKIHLRCPLIPGVNDGAKHLAGIAALSARYPHLAKVELLPYHNIGNSKYERYGMTNPMPGLETANETVIRSWESILIDLGCEKALLH
jgi:pyruvate formate lyase activating enzyme